MNTERACRKCGAMDFRSIKLFKSFFKTLSLSLGLTLAALTSTAQAEMITLRAEDSGAFVGTLSNGLLAARTNIQRPLQLEMIRLDGNRVAFRDPRSGQYLRAGVGQRTNLMVASPHIRGWETFELHDRGHAVQIRSVQSGEYVGYNRRTGRLRAVHGRGEARTRFRIVPIAERAQAQPQPAARTRTDISGQWQLVGLGGPNGGWLSISRAALREASIHISSGGSFSADTGCNSADGNIVTRGTRMDVQNMLVTRRLCHGDEGEVDAGMRRALGEADWFERSHDGRLMQITDRNGRVLARFRRS